MKTESSQYVSGPPIGWPACVLGGSGTFRAEMENVQKIDSFVLMDKK